ncbi:UPF0728 protein-like isoform X1 [Anneissia japonica]|uniref:UPF0728 protein-like isoform X1 n=1 Tax=Anneissia japonica TaxID=1529436 RepID=UPI00142579D9|nr:UPF0728 protein-like isoform X1 [Anneissia japonica]
MPKNAKVIVRYGPYRACGVVDYRTSRLDGLQAFLTKHGHTVELTKHEDWNTVELMVNGEMVYKCDINDLDYGGDGELDNLCLEASEAVQKAH